MSETIPDKFITIEDLAKIFAVSVSTARAWVRTGAIPKHTYIKIGHTYRFNLPKVVEALTQQVEEEKKNTAAEPEPEEEPVIVPQETSKQIEFDFDDNVDEDA